MGHKSIKFIDLFCGLGGFRLAMEKQGAKCVFSSDIDKYACATYKKNFNENPAGDITKISTNNIPNFDVLCAGFPCQPFSLAGKRMGFEDTRGTLFFDILRILKEKQPAAFFIENVAGISNHDKGRTLAIILKGLDRAGYYFDYKILNAKDYGVPQNRNRWYCIGIRKNLTSKAIFNKYIFFPEKRELELTIDDIVSRKPNRPYKISETAKKNIQNNITHELSELSNSEKIVLANNVRPSKVSFSHGLISPCLTAKMGTGGNNVPIVVNFERKLTEKECLAIMGFPKEYKIKQNYSQSYKQIGNSVVVPLLSDISNRLVEFLRREAI